MPIDEQHSKKKYKNYALLIVLLALVALFFALPIIKFSANIQ